MWDKISELDQILVPSPTGYKAYSLLVWMGTAGISGTGMAARHFITQRGPFQDGDTPLDMRWDVRVLQIVIDQNLPNRTSFFDRRWQLVDLLRPNRSFGMGDGVRPLIYRKYLPGGKIDRGIDLVTTLGSNIVTAARGKFIHNGLKVGSAFEITSGADAGTYHVVQVLNDYTVYLDANMTATATDVHWKFARGGSWRDLYCLLEDGPQFSESADEQHSPAGYREVLRFVANDPFWYGEQQQATWTIDAGIDDLIFDGEGAWFGAVPGAGRWLFTEDAISTLMDVVYWGHEDSFPTIEIDGPAVNPQIVNTTTGLSLTLTYSVSSGQTVTIDVSTGRCELNDGTNLFSYLTGDVALFAIVPEPQAANRANQISVSFDGGVVGASAVRIYYKNKYVSL